MQGHGKQPSGMCVAGRDGEAKRSRPPSQQASADRKLALWLYWLYAQLVVPLLRAHFYVTDSEPFRQQVFYYR